MCKISDIVANLMTVSAKADHRPNDNSKIEIMVLDDAQKEILVEELFQMADDTGDDNYSDLGESIREMGKLVLIGLDDETPLGLDCGACGFSSCEAMSKENISDIFEGPSCAHRLLDMGIAVGDAIRTAEIHGVRSYAIIEAGLAAKRVGLSTSRISLIVPVNVD